MWNSQKFIRCSSEKDSWKWYRTSRVNRSNSRIELMLIENLKKLWFSQIWLLKFGLKAKNGKTNWISKLEKVSICTIRTQASTIQKGKIFCSILAI
jgi:hypothetical protein